MASETTLQEKAEKLQKGTHNAFRIMNELDDLASLVAREKTPDKLKTQVTLSISVLMNALSAAESDVRDTVADILGGSDCDGD